MQIHRRRRVGDVLFRAEPGLRRGGGDPALVRSVVRVARSGDARTDGVQCAVVTYYVVQKIDRGASSVPALQCSVAPTIHVFLALPLSAIGIFECKCVKLIPAGKSIRAE